MLKTTFFNMDNFELFHPSAASAEFLQWVSSQPPGAVKSKKRYCLQLLKTRKFEEKNYDEQETILLEVMKRLDHALFQNNVVRDDIVVKWLCTMDSNVGAQVLPVEQRDGEVEFVVELNAVNYYNNGKKRNSKLVSSLCHEMVHILEYRMGHRCIYDDSHCDHFEMLARACAADLEFKVKWFGVINNSSNNPIDPG